jgi:uncharacterized protein
VPVFNVTTKKEIAVRLTRANTVFSRMKGLLGRKSLGEGEGLLISPCKGVHTFGMKFPIDVIVLDNNNCIIAVSTNLAPNRLTPLFMRAASVIELPAGTLLATTTEVGNQLEIA